jgi:hypothetical protein
MARGTSAWPAPCSPAWLLEVLGVAEYDKALEYTVDHRPNILKLAREEEWPRGQRVRLVTHLRQSEGKYPVTGHLVEDPQGQLLCRASVAEVRTDPQSGAVLPRRLLLEWPAERLRVAATLDDVVVNPPLEGERAARLFQRPLPQK